MLATRRPSVGESRNNAQSIFSINDGGTDHRADELKEQSVRVSDTELSGEWNPDDVRVRLEERKRRFSIFGSGRCLLSRVANGKKSNFYERKSMMSRASSVAGVVRRESLR